MAKHVLDYDPIEDIEDMSITRTELDKLGQQRRENDLKRIAQTDFGLRFLQSLVAGTGAVSYEIFNGNSKDFYQMGRRSVGLEILESLSRASLDLEQAVRRPTTPPYEITEEEVKRSIKTLREKR